MAPEEQIAEAAELNFWKARQAVFDQNLQVMYKLIQQTSCLTPSKKKYIDKSNFLFNDFLLNLILFIVPVGPGALHVTDAGYQMAVLQSVCLMCQGMKYSYPNGKHQNHPTSLQSRI